MPVRVCLDHHEQLPAPLAHQPICVDNQVLANPLRITEALAASHHATLFYHPERACHLEQAKPLKFQR